MNSKKVLDQKQIRAAAEKLAHDISKKAEGARSDWALVGVQRRGVPLAERLAALLKDKGAPNLPVGRLDITFYRDDMEEKLLDPIIHDTELPFDVNDKTVFLVDDVLYTGRTIRCALDQLMEFGRPRRVYLVSLVDRGHRELPIQADFVGQTIATSAEETVEVHLEEIDGEDGVYVHRGPGEQISEKTAPAF